MCTCKRAGATTNSMRLLCLGLATSSRLQGESIIRLESRCFDWDQREVRFLNPQLRHMLLGEAAAALVKMNAIIVAWPALQ